MTDKTALGDRMKLYEGAEAWRKLMPRLPVLARLDGRGFSKFTKGLRRPYDTRLSSLMIDTARHLVEDAGALIAYTQSDEISLVWYSDNPKSQIYFDGKIQKMVSTLAAQASVFFNRHLEERLPEKAGQSPTFDCRVWAVPTKDEAVNCLLWRERDATKNSITMAAREFFSHKALHGVTGTQKQEMLFQKGVNWNEYPAFFKRGTYVRRQRVLKGFSEEERARLHPKHPAKKNPDFQVERSVVSVMHMPPFGSVCNRVEVVFEGVGPQIYEEAVE